MLVASAYVRLLLKSLDVSEHELQTLLAASGVDADTLFQLDGHATAEQHIALLRKILERENDPSFSFRIGQQLHIATHGPIGIAAYTSSTLGEALSTIARFYSLRGQFVDMGLRSEKDAVGLIMNLRLPFDEVGLFLLETFLASGQTGIEFITGTPMNNGRLELGYPEPPHAHLYHEFFHLPVMFGCKETALVLPLSYLRLPSLYADPVAKLHAEQQCEQEFQNMQPAPEAIYLQVTALLRNHPGRLWTLDEVAEALHFSSRTLMRRLKEEGHSYQALHEAELQRQARIHLQDRRHTNESLAKALGYSDTSGFRRAFQRWFAMSVKEWQEREGKAL